MASEIKQSVLKRFFTVKVFTVAVTLLIAVIVGLGAAAGAYSLAAGGNISVSQYNAENPYKAAVQDAMLIDDGDLLPLVEISPDSPMCTWNENGQVLMLTWHKYPDSYIAGEPYTLQYGVVWTFTDKEIVKWYKENKTGVDNWELRLKQLIGVPEDREYTHFTALWTNPEDILRPAYAWRLTDTQSKATFEDEPEEWFREWFNGNIIWSYFDSAYPWTRLGYTCDWSEGRTKYGLSEFIIKNGSETKVEFTMTTAEFLGWLEQQAS